MTELRIPEGFDLTLWFQVGFTSNPCPKCGSLWSDHIELGDMKQFSGHITPGDVEIVNRGMQSGVLQKWMDDCKASFDEHIAECKGEECETEGAEGFIHV